MKLFVTGGTGFVGSNFINAAHDQGHELLVLRRSENSMPRVTLKKEPTWITAALDQVEESQFQGVDVVVHLAAHSMFPPYDSIENCMRENLSKPITLFKRAMSAGVKDFVVAGSCFEYGKSGERYDFIPTTAPLEPTLTYAASKAAASLAFYQMAIEYKLRLQIHRIFQVYGLGEAESRFWPSLKKAAESGADFPMTEGEQVRDFVNVSDVAKQLLEACTESSNLEEGCPLIKNLGTGKPQSIRDFAEKYWKEWGATGKLQFGAIPYRKGEVMRYVPEIN